MYPFSPLQFLPISQCYRDAYSSVPVYWQLGGHVSSFPFPQSALQGIGSCKNKQQFQHPSWPLSTWPAGHSGLSGTQTAEQRRLLFWGLGAALTLTARRAIEVTKNFIFLKVKCQNCDLTSGKTPHTWAETWRVVVGGTWVNLAFITKCPGSLRTLWLWFYLRIWLARISPQ